MLSGKFARETHYLFSGTLTGMERYSAVERMNPVKDILYIYPLYKDSG
jgi:hypothetical protein